MEVSGSNKLGKGAGAMVERFLFSHFHLAKSPCVALRDEDRVIAEAVAATGWKFQMTVDPPLEGAAGPVRPGQCQNTEEAGAAVGFVAQFGFDPGHGGVEILVRAAPARRRCAAGR